MAGLVLASCGGYPDDIDLGGDLEGETDRLLFSKALIDLERGTYEQARLLLQNLIGTYPESEYVPQAKYAMGESFYRGGTRSGYIQADIEFKDFLTFFPTSPLADDAQMMRAMTHIRIMQKPGRDSTEAQLARVELEALIADHPDSNLLDEAKEKLRAVQNVLAEHALKVGNFYYSLGYPVAAIGRYQTIVDDYPDFEGMAEVRYRMGEVYRRAQSDGEAILHYEYVVRNFPGSDFDEPARRRLRELGQPIPEVNPGVLVRLEPESTEYVGLFPRMMGLLSGTPDNISMETTAASILVRDDAEGETRDGEFSVEGVVVGANGSGSQ